LHALLPSFYLLCNIAALIAFVFGIEKDNKNSKRFDFEKKNILHVQ